MESVVIHLVVILTQGNISSAAHTQIWHQSEDIDEGFVCVGSLQSGP